MHGLYQLDSKLQQLQTICKRNETNPVNIISLSVAGIPEATRVCLAHTRTNKYKHQNKNWNYISPVFLNLLEPSLDL